MIKPIVGVYVGRMVESGNRISYWVTLRNSEGETITPHMFRVEGESEPGRALECANYEAEDYADFFGVDFVPLVEDGEILSPVRLRPMSHKTVQQLVDMGINHDRAVADKAMKDNFKEKST